MDDPLQLNTRHSNDGIVVRPRHGRLDTRAAFDSKPPLHETDDVAALMQYLRLLWKHKWVLLLALTLGALSGLGVGLWMTPMYVAKASLEIQKVPQPFGAPVAPANATIATQVQLLTSSTMRERVLGKVGAKTDIQEPKVGGPLADLRSLLGLKDPAKTISWYDASQFAAATFSVTPTKDSDILIIQSESPNPLAAAEFANAVVHEYIDLTQERRWESYESTGAWMTRAQQELKAKLEASEQKLAQFGRDKGLIFTAGTQNISEDKLKQLQTELLAASADRIAKQAVAESSLSSATESLPSVLDSGPMGQYQTKIVDLRRELALLQTTLTPAHYRTQQVQAQINELEAARENERTNIISRIRIEYEAAVKREAQLRREFDTQARVLANQSDDVIDYNIIQREVETNKKLYEATLAQGKEASLASALRTSSARVVDLAGVAPAPSRPNLPFILTLGMVGGLLCGALFVIVRSRSDLSIQSPGELEIQFNVRELGVIPTAATDPALQKRSAFSRTVRPAANGAGGKLLGAALDPVDRLETVTWSQKPTVMAEAFRATMTSILFSGDNGNRPRVLVLTSASPREGKSTIISNLAIALAEINQRVLLIDADMRLPRVHDIFGVPNTYGLSDVLHEQEPVLNYPEDSLVQKTHIPNLHILPAGSARTNLSRLLHSRRLNDLLSRFRGTFDIVLIDTAPVFSAPDSRILARAADAVILVIRAHRTHLEEAMAACNCFAEDGTRILGTILNDWNPKMSTDGRYGSYSGYYSRYPYK